ncbi:MAG: filamentous hemagglutinin N-terminal domain-containing protein [Betaproteobacteria bacterium]|nr:filamentous hemagglutinin N-terminal domain-containing protein [Betaproteobacteria bacterium]
MGAAQGCEKRRWQRKLLSVAIASCFVSAGAYANPTGPAVVAGQASFATQGNLLSITNSPNSIINWQGFSIAGNEVTRFIQQSASSAVLNRVVGIDPSTILGTLQSNGRVVLVNPNGVFFGQGSVVDVAGLVVSSLNLSNADFLAGRFSFPDTPGAKGIENQGTITTRTGGHVYLVAPDIKNSGVITAPGGEILLAAGKSVELVDGFTPDLRVRITAPDNQALNLGSLVAQGGRVGIYAGLIRHSGTVSADTAVVGENGKIILKATRDVTLDAASVASANGPQGGSVTIQSETGTTLVAGTVEARGSEGTGGIVRILGNLVGLTDGASVNASGESGGGTVLIGGDFQGKNPEVQNAWRTYFGSGASIVADAIGTGDGGKVIVWSDDATRAYGTISARGGAQSGNGGLVEVSGKQTLAFDARVDVSAPRGAAGTLLLDPQDIVIDDTTGISNSQLSADTPTAGDPKGSIYFADGGTITFTVTDEALEAQTGNIVLQANRDITVNAGLSDGGLVLTNQTGGERVVLQAGRHIEINSPLITNGAAIWLEADSPHSNGYPATTGTSGANGAGAVRIDATVRSFDTDPATGGKITLIAGSNTSGGTNGGGFELDADVNAGAGGIDVALSTLGTGTLDFFIGSQGQAQFTSTDTGQLKSTGQLKIGEATTAGSDGLGPMGLNDQITIKVDSLAIGTSAGGPVTLADTAGTSLVLTAGDGGISVERPLSTDQPTTIDTTGALTIEAALTTNDNSLTVFAASISGTDFINTGAGSFTCTGTGCPGGTPIIWDGEAGDLNWFTDANWSGDVEPTSADAVEIHSSTGTILISGGDASAKSLIAEVPFQISGTGSLTLADASQFTQSFDLSGSLLGAGAVAVSGSLGNLTWNDGGAMGPGGTFTLGGSSTGTLTGTLTLDRLFQNSGTLTLSGVTINGAVTGSITNAATLVAATGTTNEINVALSNPTNSVIQLLGSLTVSNFPVNAGQITIGTGATFSSSGASLENTSAGTIAVDAGGTLNLGSGTFDNSGVATIDGAASVGTLTLSAGTVGGTGDLTVSTDFSEAGGTLGTTLANLTLNKTGNLTVGASGFTATNSVTLIATGGITLDGAVTASSGTGDAITLSGTSFTNNVGALALSPGSGRWLVYSGNPAITNTVKNGLVADFKRYNCTYASGCLTPGTSVPGTGNGFLYSIAPTLAVTADAKTKTYGDADPSFTFGTSGFIDGDTVASALAGGLTRDAGETVAGGPYAINQGTLASPLGYTLSYTGNAFTIDPRAITLAADAASKTYGDADPALSVSISAGSLGSVTVTDTLAEVTGTVTREAGETVAGSPYDLQLGAGAKAANYAITFTADNNAFTITPATLTYVANAASRERGDPNPAFSGNVMGFVNNPNLGIADTQANATSGILAFTSPATQSSLEGQYAINGSGLTANNGNYVFSQAPGNATALTVTAPVHFTWTSSTGGSWDAGSNWNKGFAPVTGAIVQIPDLTGSVTITYSAGTSSVNSVTSFEGLMLSGGTLNLGTSAADVSTFHPGAPLTLAGGSLGGAGTINVSVLNWTAGTMSGAGTTNVSSTFDLSGAASKVLDARTLNIDASGSAALDGSGGLTFANGAVLTNAGTLTATAPVSGSGTFNNGGSATFGESYGISTTNVSGGTVTFNGAASTGTLALSGGTVNGTGSLAVTADFDQTGGSLGATFGDLALTRSGNFTVGSVTATNSVSLTATGGALVDGNGAGVNVTAPNATLTAANGINLDTQVGNLTATTSASGDVVLRETDGATVLGLTAAGGNATVTSAAGNLNVVGTISVSGGLLELDAVTGNLTVSAATSGPFTVSARDISLHGTTIRVLGSNTSSGTTLVTASRNMTLSTDVDMLVEGGTATGGAVEISGGPGTFAGTIGGDLTIKGGSGDGASALVHYNPDIGTLSAPLDIGGSLIISGAPGSAPVLDSSGAVLYGANAFAALKSDSSATLFIRFTDPGSSGYVVNGTGGAIADGLTGIFAGNLFAAPAPAVLETSTNVGNLVVGFGTGQLVRSSPALIPPAVDDTVNFITHEINISPAADTGLVLTPVTTSLVQPSVIDVYRDYESGSTLLLSAADAEARREKLLKLESCR